jgi:hypothetical protein
MAKTPQKPVSKTSPPVVLATLADWPLAPRIAKLVGLPAEVLGVTCYQTPGAAPHRKATKEAFFARKSTPAPAVQAVAPLLRATLEACTREVSDNRSGWDFHGSADVATLRKDLEGKLAVRTRSEDLAARRASPAATIEAIEAALAQCSVPHRKALSRYLAGGPFDRALLEIGTQDLSTGFVASAEAFGVVDRRLLFLWARTADAGAPFPSGGDAWERGHDRFQASIDELVAVGVAPDLALDCVLVYGAQTSRWWASTAIHVWEQLLLDGPAFVSRVVSKRSGELRLVELFTSLAWLPKALLDAGPRELVRKLCAVPGLVPDRTITEMLDDSTCSETFEPLRQPKVTRAVAGPAVRTTRPPPLVAVTSDADIARKLADLVRADDASTTAPIAASVAASVATSPAAPDAAIASARTERVRTAAQALSDLSGSVSRPASDAQLRSLETFLGSLHDDLRAYFGVTAKPGDGLAPSGTETRALSMDEALRETKALRKYGADPGLLALFSYGSGDYACFDSETAKIVYWDHETRGTSEVDPDLATALERLVIGPAKRSRGGKKRRVG